MHLIDSYMRLHRRRAARGFRAYRGSCLAAAPDTYPSPVALLSVAPPLLMELCHRKHSKLVIAVTFKLTVMNDSGLPTLPPRHGYALGMDVLLQNRSYNHIKKLLAKHEPMSVGMQNIAAGWVSTLSDSEGEWQAPRYDINLLGLPPRGAVEPESDSSGEADPEWMGTLQAVADSSRPRAVGTRWQGLMRN